MGLKNGFAVFVQLVHNPFCTRNTHVKETQKKASESIICILTSLLENPLAWRQWGWRGMKRSKNIQH